MTKEQKEKALAFLKDMQECTYDGVEEIRTAIESLEQQPSDDGYKGAIKDISELLAYADEKFIRECYPNESTWNLFDLNAKYGLAELLKTWKNYQNKIKVGDVVRFNEKSLNYNQVKDREYLVLHIFDNGLVTLLYDNGDTGSADLCLLYKTKKHIPEVEQLLSYLVKSEG